MSQIIHVVEEIQIKHHVNFPVCSSYEETNYSVPGTQSIRQKLEESVQLVVQTRLTKGTVTV